MFALVGLSIYLSVLNLLLSNIYIMFLVYKSIIHVTTCLASCILFTTILLQFKFKLSLHSTRATGGTVL